MKKGDELNAKRKIQILYDFFIIMLVSVPLDHSRLMEWWFE